MVHRGEASILGSCEEQGSILVIRMGYIETIFDHSITFRAVSADSYLSFYHRQLRLENA